MRLDDLIADVERDLQLANAAALRNSNDQEVEAWQQAGSSMDRLLTYVKQHRSGLDPAINPFA